MIEIQAIGAIRRLRSVPSEIPVDILQLNKQESAMAVAISCNTNSYTESQYLGGINDLYETTLTVGVVATEFQKLSEFRGEIVKAWTDNPLALADVETELNMIYGSSGTQVSDLIHPILDVSFISATIPAPDDSGSSDFDMDISFRVIHELN